MKVFVLEGLIEYEGSDVLGAYSSFEEANQAGRSYHYMEESHRRYNGYLVHEIELGAPASYEFNARGVLLKKKEWEDEYD